MRVLAAEQQRTERSGRSFALMLLEATGPAARTFGTQTTQRILAALSASVRDTDTVGWYETGSIIGVIFTEIGGPAEAVVERLSNKVSGTLRQALGDAEFENSTLAFWVYPEDRHRSYQSFDSAWRPHSIAAPELDLSDRGQPPALESPTPLTAAVSELELLREK